MALKKYKECISGINLKDDSALILGNGASISLSDQFNYKNLYEKATQGSGIDEKSQQLFESFETTNFEEILYKLQICKTVNETIGFHDEENRISLYYDRIKNTLIQIVRQVHPESSDIFNSISNKDDIADFLCQFKYVINLNYDLLVYYILLSKNEEFADGFGRSSTTQRLKFCENFISGKTQLFYPHGNLALAIDGIREEFKIKKHGTGSLLSTILDEWEQNDLCHPLFICEGESKKKKEAILKNSYLNYVYRSILPHLPKNIICYGWSVGENDQHILQQIFQNQECKKLFISIYDKNKDQEEVDRECHKIEDRIHQIGEVESIDFFSSMDDGCWLKYKLHDE